MQSAHQTYLRMQTTTASPGELIAMLHELLVVADLLAKVVANLGELVEFAIVRRDPQQVDDFRGHRCGADRRQLLGRRDGQAEPPDFAGAE